MPSSSRWLAFLSLVPLSGLFLAAAESSKTPPPSGSSPTANGAAVLKASGITAAQLVSGAKTGLAAMIDLAATEGSKPGAVQVGIPSSMNKLVGLAQKMNQTGALDAFKSSLNGAATSVMPQTTAVLKASLAGITADDAMALTSGAPDSATRLLRKAAEPAFRTKMMPLVSQALAANGTVAKAKELAAKAGPMAAMAGVPSAADLEGYLYAQVLDTSFGYLAKGESALRANPAQLKDANAAKVFALGRK